MYPYHWTWSYTFIAAVLVLSPFALCGVVLLLRRVLSPPSQEWHHSPESVSTPLGHVPYWDAVTQEMAAQGVERARRREYYNPRGER